MPLPTGQETVMTITSPQGSLLNRPVLDSPKVGDRPLSPASTNSGCQLPYAPPLSLRETDSHFYVQLSLPGVEPRDVEVHVESQGGMVRGHCRQAWGVPSGRQLQCELNYGYFERQFSLPSPVQCRLAQAEYSHGLLTLTLPKV